ncbi:tripartite tricarboxylate transporter TctB family protein [Jannaschia sp. LMIT008]|uniref:tripartite tricarboxylate transporter TctB family protein n=1 Tax=Jannaschia maritima TaxID=3032585 RepID=UPI00281131E7|nr:tripartite tricarboxylate transporter TctB family protein [Jannaschia sp. LMIT008]
MTPSYRARIDLGVAATVIAVGAVLLWEAWRIDPRSYGTVGPRFVPVFLSSAMIVLGAAIGAGALMRPSLPADPDYGFGDGDLGRVAAVIAAGAVFTLAFWAVGFMGAAATGMLLTMWVFGVRSPAALIAVPLVAAIVYQFTFMGMMGLLDPRGALLDLRPLSRLVTPD